MLGKCIAIIVLSCTSGVVACGYYPGAGSEGSRSRQRAASCWCPLRSVMLALFASAFILSPLMVLTRARAGVPNLFTWAGVILGGLLFPVSLLPMGVELVARLLPTSWAMEAVIRSMDGGASVVWIAARWAIALGLDRHLPRHGRLPVCHGDEASQGLRDAKHVLTELRQ